MSTHIFEYIGNSDRFGYGKYLDDMKIIIDGHTGYINATKLCMLGKKHLRNWHKNESSKELISCYNDTTDEIYGESSSDQSGTRTVSYEIGGDDLKGMTRKEQEVIMGTYYHRTIIVHLAQWISPTFALKVSKIVDDYISYENKRKIRELKGENKTLLDKVDDQSKLITDQSKLITDQSKQIAELLTTTRTIVDINNEQNQKLDKMASAIERMRQHLDNSTSQPSKREAILIYRNEHDSVDVMRVRCGTYAYLKKYKSTAAWYREYNDISNSKKAINYMKVNNMIQFEKDKTTKAIIPEKDDRVYIRRCLRRLNDSYVSSA